MPVIRAGNYRARVSSRSTTAGPELELSEIRHTAGRVFLYVRCARARVCVPCTRARQSIHAFEHLLPTSVGTIMKNNHIIDGLGQDFAPLPVGSASQQSRRRAAPPGRGAVGARARRAGARTGSAASGGRLGRVRPARADCRALHF